MATVIKLVNELIAKEDINWGDASTTFSRETYAGGSVNVHYVDDSIIPASGLGGYIDDHLHVQNTDTGTTSTSFMINTGGTGVTLTTTGLTADRTFTFPDTSDQALIGATDLASTAASLGATLVGVRDSGNYFSATNVETVLQEMGLDVASLQTSTHNSGMKNGFHLGYSAATAITITGGMWAHNGTANQHVYTTSQITFTLGPAGSNAASTALGPSQFHYIYIDDSAVVAAASKLLTAAEFLNSTTAPSWSESKVGWYNGNDRCIGAVLTSAASVVLNFITFSKNYYAYKHPISEFSLASCGTTYAALDVSSSVPAFSTMCRLQVNSASANVTYLFDITNSDWSLGQHNTGAGLVTFDVPLSSAQTLYWYGSAANGTTIYVNGYYTDRL